MAKSRNIIGEKFGKLTVVEEDLEKLTRYPSGAIKHYYKCDCDCGKQVSVDKQALINGHTKSCGCSKFGSRVKDLTGQKFGRLTVKCRDIERDKEGMELVRKGLKSGHNTHWICDCDCGNTVSVVGNQLKKGKTISCGCYFSEMLSERNKKLCTETNEFEIIDSVVKVYSRDKTDYFEVDLIDYEYIKNWFWRKDRKDYWVANTRQDDEFIKTSIKVHQLIAIKKYNGYDESKYIPEHLSRNKSDNKRSNIVLKTVAENARNRSLSKTNTSGKTGVSWDKSKGKYVVNIMVNYTNHYLGAFDTYEEAVQVRKEAELKFGFTCDDVFPEQDKLNNKNIK